MSGWVGGGLWVEVWLEEVGEEVLLRVVSVEGEVVEVVWDGWMECG